MQIQGDTDENIKKAVDLIEPLLHPYDDPEHRNSQLLQVAMRSVLRDEYCDNCGERGHKVWNCPNKLGNGFKKPDIMCALCKDRSHPTTDCPLRRCMYVKLIAIAGPNTRGEQDLQEDFQRFMIDLKGPSWYLESAPRSIRDREDRLALEYNGTANYDATPEALSQNVGTNQTLRPGNPSTNRVLAIAAAPADNLAQTSFKGSNHTIKLENVIMLDGNGMPMGTHLPEGAVSNPIMNPLYATMYTPYITAYNYMMLNQSAYYSAVPQGRRL